MFAGGLKECRSCKLNGEACARGGKSHNYLTEKPGDPPSHVCPQRLHAPQTFEGQAVLDVIRRGGALRIGFGGVEGVDARAVLDRLAGVRPVIDPAVALELIDAAQDGVLKGVEQARAARKPNPKPEG
ncbi:hypothetical protein [Maricaulis sp.]|uniref:hypothetical protein n=1 Tax=Maricaulis sp. TaxID=1486257 RepID=UPI003A8F7E5E